MNTQESEVIIRVNDKDASEKLKQLEEESVRLRKKFNEAFARGDTQAIKETAAELNKVNRQMDNMRTNAANINAAMKRLNEASPRELHKTIKLINSELNSGRVPRGSKEWEEYAQKLKAAKEELAKVNEELGKSDNLFDTIKDAISDFGVSAASAIAAFAGLAIGGKDAVESFAQMQKEEANVRKFTGMTADEVKRLNDEFKKFDTFTTREELNQLAQEAGRLGKQSVEDVLAYVKAAYQINGALDDLGEGATLTLSKLTSLFGDEQRLGTEKSLLAVGSVINELSQNCAAGAPYIAEFAARLGGVAAQANMTSQQIMAYAAVLDAAGVNVEASSTALQQFMVRIYQDPAKYAKTAGIEVSSFTNLVKTDLNEAMLQLLDTINRKGGMDVLAPLFKDMGEKGANAIKTLSILAGQIAEVRQQQDVANQAFEAATSISEEFAVQNSTVIASLDKAKKRFNEMSVELGEKLYPAMKYCIDGSTMMMKVFMAIINFIIRYKTELVAATAGVAAYTLAVKANSIAQAFNNGITATSTFLLKTMRPLILAVQLAYYSLTGQIRKAAVVQSALNAAWSVAPIALAIGALTAAAVAMASYRKRTEEAIKTERAAKEAAEEHSRSLRDIEAETNRNAKNELQRVKALYHATQDETKSREERLKAVNDLKAAYPEYFSKINTETILIGNASDAYDKLCESILNTARARAAENKITENTDRWIDAEARHSALQEQLDEKNKELLRQQAIADANTTIGANGYKGYNKAALTALGVAKQLRGEIDDLLTEMDKLEQEMFEIEDANQELSSKYGIDIANIHKQDNPKPTIPTTEYEIEDKNKLKKRLEAVKAELEQEEALNIINYVTGEKNYEQYINKKKIIDMGLIDNQLAVLEELGQTDSKLYADLLLKRSQLQKKWAEDNRATTLAELESEYEQRKKTIIDNYTDSNNVLYMNDQAYKQLMLQEELNFLQKKLKLYKDDAKERVKIERQINKLITDDQVAKAKENRKLRTDFEKQYLTSKLDSYKKSLKKIDKLEKEGIITADEATKARLEDLKKYLSSIGQEFSASLVELSETIFSAIKGLGAGTADIVSSSLGIMVAALSQYSSFANAERDLEIAKIEKRYDTEISAAGKNKKKVEKLEKEKEAEIAKTKKKYNDRAMKIEIAQAIAQTAQAAIAAYASAAAIPVTGWLMAPIAAALATAAGMLQVATIKKQHQAESAGYYEGGFTGGRDYRKEVGVVHGGEFVANHYAVNNPALAPVLRLIDYAQRNNTVGSLTTDDVRAVLSQSMGVSARGGNEATHTTTTITNVIDVEALDRLNQILEKGINATVSIDGERGIDAQYTRFKKLNDNAHR